MIASAIPGIDAVANALESIVKTDVDRWYPIHRLLLHLFHPPLAKHIATSLGNLTPAEQVDLAAE